MEFDKTMGKWCNEDTIPLWDKERNICSKTIDYNDNVAYQLYLNWNQKRPHNTASQIAMIIHKKVYKDFYERAEHVIRFEKITKITNGIKNRTGKDIESVR